MSGSCAGHSHSLLREEIQEFGQDYLNRILGPKITLWSFSQDMIMQDYISVLSQKHLLSYHRAVTPVAEEDR